MPWRQKFQHQNLQQVIEDSLKQLKDELISKTDPIKKKRMQQQLQKDILTAFNESKKTKVVDLANKEKYLYTTVNQVKHFVQVSGQPDFSGLEKLLFSAKTLLSYHLNLSECAQTITDYGCGNGVKISWVYNKLNELFPNEQRGLLLVDYNDIILQTADSISTELSNTNLVTTAIRDMEIDHLVRERKDSPMLHFLLGQTIGNFKNPNPVVENLAKSMRKREYLVVEWFNRHFSAYEEGRQENGTYTPNTSGQRNLDFLYNYFEALDFPKEILITDKNGHFMSEERDKRGNMWNIGYLILQDDFKHESGTILEKGTKLIGLRSRRFQEKEVISLFEKYGLEAQFVDWQMEMKRVRIMGEAQFGVPDNPPMEEVRTHEKKWLVHNHQRYAVLKKVKEPASKLKIAGMGLLGTIAAAVLGLGIGSHYFWEKVIDCENPKVDYLTIICDDGYGEKLNIKEIEIIRTKEDKAEGLKIKKGELVYNLNHSSAEKREAIERLDEIKKKSQQLFGSSNSQRCMNWGIQKCGNGEDCLETIAGKKNQSSFSATDSEGDKLTWKAQKIPFGAKLIDHGDGNATFSWTPSKEYTGKTEEAVLTVDDGRGGITSKKIKIIVQEPFKVNSIDELLSHLADCTPDSELLLRAQYLANEYSDKPALMAMLVSYLINKRECNIQDIISSVDLFNRKDVSIPLKKIYSLKLNGFHVSGGPLTIEEMEEAGEMKYDKDNKMFEVKIGPFQHVFDFMTKINGKRNVTMQEQAIKLLNHYNQTTSLAKFQIFSILNLASNYLDEQGFNNFLYFVEKIRDQDNPYFIAGRMFNFIKRVNLDERAKRNAGEMYNLLYGILLKGEDDLSAIVNEVVDRAEDLYTGEFKLNKMTHDPQWVNLTIAYAQVITQKCVTQKFRKFTEEKDSMRGTRYRFQIFEAIKSEHPDASSISTNDIYLLGLPQFTEKYHLCKK